MLLLQQNNSLKFNHKITASSSKASPINNEEPSMPSSPSSSERSVVLAFSTPEALSRLNSAQTMTTQFFTPAASSRNSNQSIATHNEIRSVASPEAAQKNPKSNTRRRCCCF
uniref:Uncharacterized protein n=1 Tax=Globodera rostochiensis TaxID=31243 RepID=A0A914I006_GLORO